MALRLGSFAGGAASGLVAGAQLGKTIREMQRQRAYEEELAANAANQAGLQQNYGYEVRDTQGNAVGYVPTEEAAREYTISPDYRVAPDRVPYQEEMYGAQMRQQRGLDDRYNADLADTSAQQRVADWNAGQYDRAAQIAAKYGKTSEAAAYSNLGLAPLQEKYLQGQLAAQKTGLQKDELLIEEAKRKQEIAGNLQKTYQFMTTGDYEGLANFLNKSYASDEGQYKFLGGDGDKELIYGFVDNKGNVLDKQHFKADRYSSASDKAMDFMTERLDVENAPKYYSERRKAAADQLRHEELMRRIEASTAAMRPDSAELLNRKAMSMVPNIMAADSERFPESPEGYNKAVLEAKRMVLGLPDVDAKQAIEAQKGLAKLEKDYTDLTGQNILPPPTGKASADEKLAYQMQEATLDEMARNRGLPRPRAGGRLPAPTAIAPPGQGGLQRRSAPVQTVDLGQAYGAYPPQAEVWGRR